MVAPNPSNNPNNPNNPNRPEFLTLPDRGDIAVKFKDDEATIRWRPTGPNLQKSAEIEFKISTSTCSAGAVLDIVKDALTKSPGDVGKVENPLNSEFFRKMLDSSKLSRLENCAGTELLLIGSHLTDSAVIKNCKFANSNIALRGKQLALDHVEFVATTLVVESGAGTFDSVTIDSKSTLAGDLGQTRIDKNTCLHCYAGDVQLKQVSWEEPASIATRTKGMIFRFTNVDAEIFNPKVCRALSKSEFKAECIKRNEQVRPENVISILKREPISGSEIPGGQPCDKRYADLGIIQTHKLGFLVERKSASGQDQIDYFMAELPVLPKGVLLAPSVFYKLAEKTDAAFTPMPLKRVAVNNDLIVEALKKCLDRDSKDPPKKAIIPQKRRKFDPAILLGDSSGDGLDPFKDIFLDESDSGMRSVL